MKQRAGVRVLLPALLALAAAPVGPSWGRDREVSGVRFTAKERTGDARLYIVGAGLVRRFGLRIFAGAFYLEPGTDPADRFKPVPKKLVLEYYRHITAGGFAKTTEESLAAGLSKRELAAVRKDLERVKASFEDVRKGDRYAVCYTPAEGMTLRLNGEARAVFTDERFINAFFGIWLGDRPVDDKFKRAALGEG